MSDLSELFNVIAEGKKAAAEQREREERILHALQGQLISMSMPPPDIEIVNEELELVEETIQELEEIVESQVVDDTLVEETPAPVHTDSLLDKAVSQISKAVKVEEAVQQPVIPLTEKSLEAVTKKIRFLEQWLAKVASTGPGSGEVNFRYLDDVNRATMTESNNNWVLEYDSATKKVKFTEVIGPIQQIHFNLEHVHDEVRLDGTLCWDPDDRTLNLTHPGGVTQQVGQEQYYLVRNTTGSTIINGSVCRFAGAIANDNGARLLAAPLLANGTYPSLYIMGVATQDIPNNGEGLVTSFGKVRSLNTTGGAESWQLGNILYASPTTAGGMTNIKPTAPNNVIPVAAIVSVDSTEGEIFVRPTIEQRTIYGSLSDTTDQSPALANTAYAITYDTINISNGVSRGSPTSRIVVDQSGYYTFDICLSLTSTNSSAKAIYVWAKKNGNNVPYSTRRQSVTGNGTYQILKIKYDITLNANEYIEIFYLADNNTISINSPTPVVGLPSIPSVTVIVEQVAL